MVRLAQDAAESLDGRIEEEDLNGIEGAVEVRAALARLQALSVPLRGNTRLIKRAQSRCFSSSRIACDTPSLIEGTGWQHPEGPLYWHGGMSRGSS